MTWNQQREENEAVVSGISEESQGEDRRGMQSNRAQRSSSQMLSAGQWTREVLGLKAPFGHDGMPTVWG